MLISLQDRLQQDSVVELLGYSVFPDQEKLDEAIGIYHADDHILMGYLLEDEIIGIIGYQLGPDDSIKLNHLSVDPEYRGMGYGRGMILELIDQRKPKKIIVETDEEAVDFYRNIGFEITSLGETFPHAERFACTFVTDFSS